MSATVRFKIQDVVPSPQGYYVTAGSPDLDLVQCPTTRFQLKVPRSELMAINKESVLVVRGTVRGASQTVPRSFVRVLGPGGSVSFALRGVPGCEIWLDGISYQVEAGGAARPMRRVRRQPLGKRRGGRYFRPPASPARGEHGASDALRSEQTRSVDDVKSFFLNGIAPALRPTAGKITSTPQYVERSAATAT